MQVPFFKGKILTLTLYVVHETRIPVTSIKFVKDKNAKSTPNEECIFPLLNSFI